MKEKESLVGADEAKHINLEEYNYPLPDEKIAKYPLEERTSCKLLCYNPQEREIQDTHFYEAPSLIASDSLLLRNNSRVIHARLQMQRDTGAKIEIFCLSPAQPSSYDENLSSRGEVAWHCLVGNSKKWKSGTLETEVVMPDGNKVILSASRDAEDPFLIHFQFSPSSYCFGDVLDCVGNLPIPPYLGRETEESDLQNYQTIYASSQGSVAAPTAGLHFTESLTEELTKKGVEVADVTLHVGAGTFLPVKGDDVANHVMHSEVCHVSRTIIEALLRHKGSIVAVGTTSVRTLESLYYLALNHIDELTDNPSAEKLPHIDQWEPYQKEHYKESHTLLETLLRKMQEQSLEVLFFSTALFIIPGYSFHYTSRLITNFHQPKSTLLLMISAFIGDDWKQLYQHALQNEYRFLSYGDACLLTKRI